VDRLLSDSRVPPGDMFVHRNIATLVVQTDMNLLSILQYAIDVQVNYLTVCGQCGCGGVKAAMNDAHHGLIDNWLRAVKDTQQYLLDGTGRAGRARPLRPDGRDERHRASLQLDKTNIVQFAWQSRGRTYINGWVLDLRP